MTSNNSGAIIVNVVSECAGTGRQARLRGVCQRRTGSSPVTRTKNPCSSEQGFLILSAELETKEKLLSYILTYTFLKQIILQTP